MILCKLYILHNSILSSVPGYNLHFLQISLFVVGDVKSSINYRLAGVLVLHMELECLPRTGWLGCGGRVGDCLATGEVTLVVLIGEEYLDRRTQRVQSRDYSLLIDVVIVVIVAVLLP